MRAKNSHNTKNAWRAKANIEGEEKNMESLVEMNESQVQADIDTHGKAKSLLDHNPVYKPFRYPWAYEAWLTQQRIHWLPEEVPMADDVKDWNNNLSDAERNLLTQIFRFFTQSDIEVNNCYMRHYMNFARFFPNKTSCC